jgi:hypothetical protein
MKLLLALGLLLPMSPAAPAAKPLLAHQEPRGIGNLVVPGDRARITYAVDSSGVKSATGVLYVRNDRTRRFAHVRLRKLSAAVPQRLLHGHKLTYYAVINDPRTKRTVRLPTRTAWILERPIRIQLGTHRFGKTRAPEAVVAHWPASEVGWQTEGDVYGPETFLVAADGSIWLDDELNNRMLVSAAGGSRTVPLPPGTNDGDVAFGPGGTVYASGGEGVGRDAHRVLYRLSATGGILWKERLHGALGDSPTFLIGTNSPLRFGPEGTLYCLVGMFGLPGGVFGWMPVARPDGRPLAEPAQRSGTHWPYQPAPGGLRLVSESYTPSPDGPPREARFALLRADRLVRAWRVTSRTDLNFDYFTPEFLNGDLVVAFDVTRATQAGFKWEYSILRLGPHGLRARFSLPRVVYGDNLLADLRLGPDGKLYELGSSPESGVTISRYSLAGS